MNVKLFDKHLNDFFGRQLVFLHGDVDRVSRIATVTDKLIYFLCDLSLIDHG